MAEKRSWFGSTEDLVSMFLGLVIVVVIGGLVVNFFQKRKGQVNVPGVSTETQETEKVLTPVVGPVGETDRNYEVGRGESLWTIAEREYKSGYKWVEIAKANKLIRPNMLFVGQKLILPKIAPVEADSSVIQAEEYRVVSGDNLWEISVRKYGDGFAWPKVWQANRVALRDPNKLEIGMKLILPKI